MTYLDAYEATKDPFYLEAAKDTAMALVNGQLESGGWTQKIHFAKVRRGRQGRYRRGGPGAVPADPLSALPWADTIPSNSLPSQFPGFAPVLAPFELPVPDATRSRI